MTGALDAAELLPGETQRGRRVAGLATIGLDTLLHTRQEAGAEREGRYSPARARMADESANVLVWCGFSGTEAGW